MALTTTKKPTLDAAPTLADLQRTHDEAAAVVSRCRAIANPMRFGESGWGASPLERLQAMRDLPAAEVRLFEAAITLEEAKAVSAATERERYERTLAEARAFVRRELPPLIREVRSTQAKLQALTPTLNEFDRLTGGYLRFAPAACPEMEPGGAIDAWVRAMVSLFDLEPE